MTMYTSSTDVYMTDGNLYVASDERLKDFVGDIDVQLNDVKRIPKKYYTWKDDKNKNVQIGTSAQKLKEIYPELVSEDENGKLAVSYEKLSVIALSAIDKLCEENQLLKDRLSKIEKLLNIE